MKSICKISAIVFSFVILCIALLCITAAFFPNISNYFNEFNRSLPKCMNKVEYTEGGFGDFTTYGEYYYNENSIEKFRNNKYFSEVDDSNISDIKEYFENFEQNLMFFDYKNKYTFDKTQIKKGDFFYIKTLYDEPFDNYDVYYVDTDKMIMYHIHNNI